MMSENKFINRFTVIENQKVNRQFSRLILQKEGDFPTIFPGQFVQVQTPPASDTYLRLPISIHFVDTDKKEIHLLVQKVGEGSRALCSVKEGDELSLIYPLGKGFSLPEKAAEKVLLIGGGCGIAPLLYLAKSLMDIGCKPSILMGGRSCEQIICVSDFSSYGEVFISTEDGSMGEKGLVSEHSILKKSFDRLYTCGPEAMMKAVARKAQAMQAACELSLENTMACGIGACLCCVTPTQKGHVCVCTQGPVFNYTDLKDFI